MKKLFLLLASGSIAITGSAQMRSVNMIAAPDQKGPGRFQKVYERPKSQLASRAHKTTAAPNRTYIYGNLFDTLLSDVSSLETGVTAITMWQNDKIFGGFTAGYDTIQTVSCGTVLDPSCAPFNNPTYFAGEMMMGNGDAYTVNSVEVFGVYDFNPANTAAVDTLILSFVQGNGGSPTVEDIFTNGTLTGGHYGTLSVLSMRYDTTALNYARTGASAQGTPSDKVYKIPLVNSGTSPEWGDTTASGIWSKVVTLTPPVAVSAGNMVGMSISFKSGNTLLTPYDTVFYTGGAMKYNMMRPLVIFASDGTDAQWAPNSVADSNTGYYKTLPHNANGWSYTYVPHWAYFNATTSGAATQQYPFVAWDITCTTCGNVTLGVKEVSTAMTVNAYPNPGKNELNIPFTLGSSSDVTITLTNMLGQVVASQNMKNVAEGKAVFNTAVIPAGVYNYTVNANGQRATGSVVIAH